MPVGRGVVCREGHSGLLILAFGALVKSAEIIGERLDATVVNMRFVKPLDEELVLRLAAKHGALVTIEENAVAGGAGSAVIELLAGCAQVMPTLTLGIPDRFIEHGSREDCLVAGGTRHREPRRRGGTLVGPRWRVARRCREHKARKMAVRGRKKPPLPRSRG